MPSFGEAPRYSASGRQDRPLLSVRWALVAFAGS